ncbi:lytic murein transglycosylase [Bosea sp. SSUT16]|jgi:lytic murein transglycosylase|uniref:Lytic murein transglycosylase n=1 Tax=Bosea spartocytisi TaxID=2773451 RepID=A0A927EG01_9HYPH|nr:lytic murein transglycosylase [Bosea spartocytisi]MBD3848899.1 lytic murein transglycosylase [Bosea spartocytisi]MCT4474989.1 lytic murein transglycosylase [Bosea spartocytisi]
MRLSVLAASALLSLAPALAQTTGSINVSRAPAGSAQASPASASFDIFLQRLWPQAQARGISRTTFDLAFRGVTPDASIVALTKKQSEFSAPIWSYLNNAVGGGRVQRGQAVAAENAAVLAQVEARYGVPKEVVLGVWGMETNFGSFKGSKDVIRSLATLAAIRYRGDFFRDELLTALELIQKGYVERDELRGSWAGAMGHTQFMPSSYMKYAVDWTGNGHADIWNSSSDAIASTANYLKSYGWVPGLPWGMEVSLPDGFDHRLDKASFAAFRSAGVRRADGRALPSSGEGRLFYPAGHTGPVLLLTANFDVIKKYNSSDAYALAVGHLGDRIMGRAAIQADWPLKAARLDMAGTKDLQRRLKALGLYDHDADGRIGTGTREAVRRYQISVGEIADGYPTPALLTRMRGSR